MQPATLFDYASLEPTTRDDVRRMTGEIRERIKRAASDIFAIGERLIAIKTRLGHGHFGAWLRDEFDWDERTAQRYMAVAERFKSDTVSDLRFGTKALYALSAPTVPEAARVEAVTRAEAGEEITHKTAQELIAKHRPQPAGLAVAASHSSPLFIDEEESGETETQSFEESATDEQPDEDEPIEEVVPSTVCNIHQPEPTQSVQRTASSSLASRFVVPPTPADPEVIPLPAAIRSAKAKEAVEADDKRHEVTLRQLRAFHAAIREHFIGFEERGGVVENLDICDPWQIRSTAVYLEELGQTALRFADEIRTRYWDRIQEAEDSDEDESEFATT